MSIYCFNRGSQLTYTPRKLLHMSSISILQFMRSHSQPTLVRHCCHYYPSKRCWFSYRSRCWAVM